MQQEKKMAADRTIVKREKKLKQLELKKELDRIRCVTLTFRIGSVGAIQSEISTSK